MVALFSNKRGFAAGALLAAVLNSEGAAAQPRLWRGRADADTCGTELSYWPRGWERMGENEWNRQKFALVSGADASPLRVIVPAIGQDSLTLAERSAQNGAVVTGPTFFKGTNEEDFLQNFAHGLVDNRVDPRKVGIVVPANHGLPGGKTSIIPKPDRFRGVAYRFPLNTEQIKINREHGGEESLLSNWYVHSARGLATDPIAKAKMIAMYQKTLMGAWGMKTNTPGDNRTIQQMDYTTTTNPYSFADCWVLANPRLGRQKNGRYVDIASGGRQFGAFLFVAAPNGNRGNSAWGSMTRTLSTRAQTHFGFFEAGVHAAISGAIDAAIREQLERGRPLRVLLFNKLGGGIYWPRNVAGDKNSGFKNGGPTAEFYENLIQQVLQERVSVQINGVVKILPKGAFFEAIYVTGLVKGNVGAQQGQNAQQQGQKGQQQPPPQNDGLSGGAIAGIVIGSVAGAGLIGFLIWWFAIKK
ncbi:unnamed protein product [Amoebophrya sp. A25]|nr:unnamed protein product [Amoebophrya sp. A25]|eukprot:GSA25T00019000001.1